MIVIVNKKELLQTIDSLVKRYQNPRFKMIWISADERTQKFYVASGDEKMICVKHISAEVLQSGNFALNPRIFNAQSIDTKNSLFLPYIKEKCILKINEAWNVFNSSPPKKLIKNFYNPAQLFKWKIDEEQFMKFRRFDYNESLDLSYWKEGDCVFWDGLSIFHFSDYINIELDYKGSSFMPSFCKIPIPLEIFKYLKKGIILSFGGMFCIRDSENFEYWYTSAPKEPNLNNFFFSTPDQYDETNIFRLQKDFNLQSIKKKFPKLPYEQLKCEIRDVFQTDRYTFYIKETNDINCLMPNGRASIKWEY